MLIKKIPGVNALVTTAGINVKIGEVGNKIPDTSSVLNTKIGEVENKIPGHVK